MNEVRTPGQILRLVVVWFIAISAGVLLFLLFTSKELDAISDPNAMDYAQVARNLAEGQGFVTDFVRPLSLAKVPRLHPHPELTFMPLHPLVMAATISLWGPNKRGVAAASAIPFLLLLALIFWVGRKLFDPRTAILATLLLGGNLWALQAAISGLEAPLLGLLFTGLCCVLYLGTGSKRELLWLAGAGVLVGLLALTKEVWGLALVPVLVYVGLSANPKRRWLALALVVAACGLTLLPWLIRNANVAGNPFFTWRWYESAMESQTNPGNTLYRSYRTGLPSPLQMLLAHPLETYSHFLRALDVLYAALPAAVGVYAIGFFLTAIFLPLGDTRFERLRYLLYGTYLLVFLAVAVIHPAVRMLFPVVPLATLIAAACFLRIAPTPWRALLPLQANKALNWSMAILVLFQCAPLLMNLVRPADPQRLKLAQQVEESARLVASDTSGPIVTDQPWLVAWYAGRTAIWLPREWRDMDEMQENIGQVRYVLLTPWIIQNQEQERSEDWVAMWQEAQRPTPQPVRGYVLYRVYEPGWRLYVRLPQFTPEPTGPPAAGPKPGPRASGGGGTR